MKKVLIYCLPYKCSVAIETLCMAIYDAGHKVLVLTLTAKKAGRQTVVDKYSVEAWKQKYLDNFNQLTATN